MGGKGPQRTPTATLRARGSWRAKVREAIEPKLPEPGVPDAPEELSLRAQQIWDKMVPLLEQMGVLSVVDESTVMGYCETYADFLKAKNADERVKISTALLRYIAQLGISPASRSNAKVLDKSKLKPANDVAKRKDAALRLA